VQSSVITAGKRQWSFAVLADTHLEPEHTAPANKRCSAILAALGEHKPDFILHLGDVVHPLPASPNARLAADIAQSMLIENTQCPVYFLPGNHDIGDKQLQGLPAKPASPEWLERFSERFSSGITCFDHRQCRFVLVNSPALDGSVESEAGLSAFLELTLENLDGRRIFLATHYPVFLYEPDEPSHYDNIVEPSRSTLLRYCLENHVEVVFSGHVHHFLFREIGRTQFIGAPSSNFLRREFSEMFRTGEFVEFGREDPFKLGFIWVDVYQKGFISRFVSLNDLDDFSLSGLAPGHPADREPGNIGVNLRHNWVETVELPFNPPTSTFARKKLREDYTFRALVELGLGCVRIPVADLADPEKNYRAGELNRSGIRLSVLNADPLDKYSRQLIEDNLPMISKIELACDEAQLDATLDLYDALYGQGDFSILYGLVHSAEYSQQRAQHHVAYGFENDFALAKEFAGRLKRAKGRHGIVFSVDMAQFDSAHMENISRFCREMQLESLVLLNRLANDMIAVKDDKTFALDVQRIIEIAGIDRGILLVLDTFMRMDRGYHVREGLVDRQLNPTAAGMILRNANRVNIAQER
jgi:predicted phosphodiesterase